MSDNTIAKDGQGSLITFKTKDVGGGIQSSQVIVSDITGTAYSSTNLFAVDGSKVTQPVSIVTVPLPTGAATSANQATANTTLSLLHTDLSGIATSGIETISGLALLHSDLTTGISINSTVLPSGAATAANQTSQLLSLGTVSDSAYVGSGNSSVISTLKGIYTAVTSNQATIVGQIAIDQTTPGTTNGVAITGTVPLPTGASTSANQTSQLTSLGATSDAAYAGTGSSSIISTLKGIYTSFGKTLTTSTASNAPNSFSSGNLINTNDAVTLSVAGMNTVVVQLASGSWTGNIALEASIDGGVTYNFISMTPFSGGSPINLATTGGIWEVSCGGLSHVRVRATGAITNAPVAVYISSTNGLKSVRILSSAATPVQVSLGIASSTSDGIVQGGATGAVVNNAGASYNHGDTITLLGGTFTTATLLTVSTTKVVSATIAAGGTGGTNGTQTVTGTTGSSVFQVSVTVAGGIITAILSITTPGVFLTNPTVLTAVPVTGAGLTGATLNIVMGINAVTVTTPGNYTTFPSSIIPNPAFPNTVTVTQASTSGSGTGATFDVTYMAYTIQLFGGIKPNNGFSIYLPKESLTTYYFSDRITAPSVSTPGSKPIYGGGGYETPAAYKPNGVVYLNTVTDFGIAYTTDWW